MVQRFDLANVGCAERIWRQAEELVRRGHQIEIVSFPHSERRSKIPRLRPDVPEKVQEIPLDRRGKSLWQNAQVIRERIGQADLVHLWKAYPDTALPVLYGLRSAPRPLHYDWDDLEGGHGGIAERLTGSRTVGRLLTYWEREILRWADTVTAASLEIEKLCLQHGFPSDRTFPGPVGAAPGEIYQAVAASWRDRFGGGEVILYLGQMEAEDFPFEILAAVHDAMENHPDLLLVMVGDGSGRSVLETEAARLGLGDRVLFTGYLPREEAQAILSLATVFLNPLRDDRMSRCKSPLVVAEAMSRGLPVIGSEVGEVPRMLGDSGVLVSSLEREPWRKALVDLIGNPEKRKRMGERAKQRFLREWTWQRNVDRLEEAYRKAVRTAEG